MGRVRSGREIDAALCKKGFSRSISGRHIQYFLNDVPRIKTMMSHGDAGVTIGDSLITRMARQLHLSKQQFLNFVDCTLSETDYRTILREQQILV